MSFYSCVRVHDGNHSTLRQVKAQNCPLQQYVEFLRGEALIHKCVGESTFDHILQGWNLCQFCEAAVWGVPLPSGAYEASSPFIATSSGDEVASACEVR